MGVSMYTRQFLLIHDSIIVKVVLLSSLGAQPFTAGEVVSLGLVGVTRTALAGTSPCVCIIDRCVYYCHGVLSKYLFMHETSLTFLQGVYIIMAWTHRCRNPRGLS